MYDFMHGNAYNVTWGFSGSFKTKLKPEAPWRHVKFEYL